MKNSSQDLLRKARNTALSLLARRRHSREEVRRKLTERGFECRIIEHVLAECERLQYINDETAADFYIEELVRKRFGLFRIRETMMSRGFDPHLINRMIDKHRLVELEPEIAAAAAGKKMPSLLRETDRRKKYEKLVGFLRSRGFSPSTISTVLSKIQGD